LLEALIRDGGKDISYLIELLEEQWHKRSAAPPGEDARATREWTRLVERMDDTGQEDFAASHAPGSGRRIRLKRWYWAAACIAVLLGAGCWFRAALSKRPSTTAVHEIIVENGARRQVRLPDGTSVWLNGGSRLWYRGALGPSNRTVWLEGEAFFRVVSDASTPFTVRAKNITVRVLGTNFNVKAYRNDPDIETTLISGKVQVLLNNDPEKKVILSPHEKLTVMSDTPMATRIKKGADSPVANALAVIPRANALQYQVQVLPLNASDSTYFTETAWVRNELAFAGQPFSEVARQMERRYNVHIVFGDDGLKNVLMSGVFDKETVVEALDVLKLITRFSYRIENDSIYLNR
jgi:ferric-dicitrate binding protein FerR (iron transport regulator)